MLLRVYQWGTGCQMLNTLKKPQKIHFYPFAVEMKIKVETKLLPVAPKKLFFSASSPALD